MDIHSILESNFYFEIKGAISGGEVVREVCLQKYQDFSGYFSKHTSLLFHPAILCPPNICTHMSSVTVSVTSKAYTYLLGFKKCKEDRGGVKMAEE